VALNLQVTIAEKKNHYAIEMYIYKSGKKLRDFL